MEIQYFTFGSIYTTPGVVEDLSMEEVKQLLEWHGQLKQGELCDEDQKSNQIALEHDERIFSCYKVRDTRYFLITEYDRSVTTIMRANEY